MENKSKYFVCKNQYEAYAIHYLTDIRFYKFTAEGGEIKYTFPRDEEIFKAYKTIMDFKNNQ